MSEPYRIRSPETWEAARLAYLEGCSADEVCARFGLGLSALRKHARAEGWRRADQAEAEPFEDEDDADDLPDMDDPALAELARRRMGVAARRGRLTEALRWARLRDFALRQMRDQQRLAAGLASPDDAETPGSPPQPSDTPRETARVILARARAEVHEVHEVHSNSPFEPGLNRTERRRRLKAMRKQTGPP
ncbi:hypothetical protein [Brevundimonas subvibrioides]|uniref:Uncharacterized protein n=1 Tax=Brevundimonas subvibrioides (strain ATCC 15264 / DSM 4735 / LMG 14903 / NBRC 16000 / CB 81) TaxID=633149 RepID=D9QG07_BRESC|nr:hypothetical protein [Brevundimonas subvibrioides]ADL02549.1 hypothetical protein Bresu_3243 [Brevundimonas subvibrioides ATCC 15264]